LKAQEKVMMMMMRKKEREEVEVRKAMGDCSNSIRCSMWGIFYKDLSGTNM
jgi:hypothetical protein